MDWMDFEQVAMIVHTMGPSVFGRQLYTEDIVELRARLRESVRCDLEEIACKEPCEYIYFENAAFKISRFIYDDVVDFEVQFVPVSWNTRD